MRAVANSIIICSEIVTINRVFFSQLPHWTIKPQTIFVPSAVKSLLATIKSIQINLFPSFFHSIVVVGLVSCSIWYCDFSFLCMYLVVLPTSLHTRCLDTFDYLWLNSKSGHLSFAVCDSIASYLLYIERVDLNSIFQLCSSSRKHWFNFEAILF